ncbi:MAG: sugar phosphate nucleotidyltransferase [Deferribacterota bacterium]|nr:sugar phosphate nucleotidyltransferase [Deferribacterota bacterium]
MQGVIMAGGFGTRMQPLTSTLPKPMLPVLNKPIMEHVIELLCKANITELVVLLYFKPEVIKSYFGNGNKYNVKINYVLPDDDYGTAGAVKKAAKYLKDTFIVISGDIITDFDLSKIINFHHQRKSKATITLTSVEDPLQFGIVITDKSDKIVKFLEKPGWGEVFSDTINTGIYIFEPEILELIPENKNYDFSKNLFPLMQTNKMDIYGYKAVGYWKDIGNPNAYREVHMDVFNKKLHLNLEYCGEKVEYPKGILYKGKKAVLNKDVRIEGMVVIGENTIIKQGTYLRNTIIGSNCIIEEGCEISNSIIWSEVVIKKYSIFNNSILCNKTRFGKFTMAKSGCVVAENTETGDHVVFEQDVMIWPNKIIEEHSIISSNLIWGDKWKRSIFEGGKVSARTNIELSPEIATKLGSAIGSMLPKGSKVLLGRDYHRAARMLKRAFISGLLSTGINSVDTRLTSLPILRYNLAIHNEVFGVYFKQSSIYPTHTEILFFDGSSLLIDTNMEKSIERIFYKENFRRVSHDEIGNIYDVFNIENEYLEHFYTTLNADLIKAKHFKVVINLLNGTTNEIYPLILNQLNTSSIVLNAYHDESKISHTYHSMEEEKLQTSAIIKTTNSDIGFIIHPHGESFSVITDKGEYITGDLLLMIFIKILDMLNDKKRTVFLPTMAPTVLDSSLKNINIIRGKFYALKTDFIRSCDFIGNLDKEYIFPEHSISPDAIYASIKLLELLTLTGKSISSIKEEIPYYYFNHNIIGCPIEKKGFLMRKMSEESMDEKASFVDGIKIELTGERWVLMVPDQYSPNIHLFIESKDKKDGVELFNEYKNKIYKWLGEKS